MAVAKAQYPIYEMVQNLRKAGKMFVSLFTLLLVVYQDT
jgi:NAD/NADP transhydrogenase beta subunit